MSAEPLCRGEDDYTRTLETDHRRALWTASLSDGSTVVMDDGRPGLAPKSDWLRLATHCRENNLSVRGMGLRFRSHVREDIVPRDADGYYFCQSIAGILTSGEICYFYLLGHLLNGKLLVQRWQVPELILMDVEERDPAAAGDRLLRR